MTNSLYETHLQGIMVVVFVKTNIQSKVMNTTTTIPCGHVSEGIGNSDFAVSHNLPSSMRFYDEFKKSRQLH